MTSELAVDLQSDDMDTLASLQPGESAKCLVEGVVKSNDGKTLVLTVESVESAGDEYDTEDEGEDMPMRGQKHKGMPLAIIAIGDKPTKE